MLLGELIVQMRRNYGWSRAELARRAGISYAYLFQIEAGQKLRRPGNSSPALLKIASALGSSAGQIIDAVSGKIPPPKTLPLGIGNPIPIISRTAESDPGRRKDQERSTAEVERYAARPPGLTDPRAFAFEIEGDSMAPELAHGTMVYCSPSLHVNLGDVVVVHVTKNQETICRTWRRKGNLVFLWPQNPSSEPRQYEISEIAWAYPVVGEYRRRKTR